MAQRSEVCFMKMLWPQMVEIPIVTLWQTSIIMENYQSLVGKLTLSIAIFNSNVKLPEGNW